MSYRGTSTRTIMAFLFLLIVVLFTASVSSLSCDCDYEHRDTYCGPVPTCPSPSALVLDPCGCCRICSKVEGDECGGPWKIYGRCAIGLKCHTTSATGYLGAGGHFGIHLEPKGICRKPGEALHTTRPCFLAQKKYREAIRTGSHRGRRDANTELHTLPTTQTDDQTTGILSQQTTQDQITTENFTPTIGQISTVIGEESTSSSDMTSTSDTQTVIESSTNNLFWWNLIHRNKFWLKTTLGDSTTADLITTTVSYTTDRLSEATTSEEKTTDGFYTTTSEEKTTDRFYTTTSEEKTTDGFYTTTSGITTTPCPIKPRCTPEGWFSPMQCDPCTGECWCVYNNGYEVPGSRKHGRVRC